MEKKERALVEKKEMSQSSIRRLKYFTEKGHKNSSKGGDVKDISRSMFSNLKLSSLVLYKVLYALPPPP